MRLTGGVVAEVPDCAPLVGAWQGLARDHVARLVVSRADEGKSREGCSDGRNGHGEERELHCEV